MLTRSLRPFAALVALSGMLLTAACSDTITNSPSVPAASRSLSDTTKKGGGVTTNGDSPIETCVTEGATRTLPDGSVQTCRGGQWGSGN